MINLRSVDIERLNSMTKYPSILTYHTLGEINGRKGMLFESEFTQPWTLSDDIVLTEKVDGTNARMIFLPDGEVLFGGKEEILGRLDDFWADPALGIVKTLRPIAHRALSHFIRRFIDCELTYELWGCSARPLFVIYGEVYGGKIGAQCRNYSSLPDITGFRVFDIAVIPNADEVLAMAPAQIAAWRDRGGQAFLDESRLSQTVSHLELELTPRIGRISGAELPHTLEQCLLFLDEWTPTSVCVLNAVDQAGSEGIVLRTLDRGKIAKMRKEDYARTLKQLRGRR